MECERCNKEYPDYFIQPLIGHGGGKLLDPECALDEMSEIHGFKFTKFTGTIAQGLLEDFREFKKGGLNG